MINPALLVPDQSVYDPERREHVVPSWTHAWALPAHLLIPEGERCWRCDEVRVPLDPEHIGLCDPCLAYCRGEPASWTLVTEASC